MQRRNSVRLQDIVQSDHKASSHYKKLQSSPNLPSMSENMQEVVTITLPDGKPLSISCDPLLIAEFLHMQENGGNSGVVDDEEDDEEDTFDEQQLSMGETVSLPARAAGPAVDSASDSASASSVGSTSTAYKLARKRSAIDEHKRVTAALREAGVLLEDMEW